MANLSFESSSRQELFFLVNRQLEAFYQNSKDQSVTPRLDKKEIISFLNQFDFDNPSSPNELVSRVVNGLTKYTVHTSHPMYYGLFNPRANFPSILADYITAVFNPQLAAWSHSPFAVEIEDLLIKEFGIKFGYSEDAIDGVFASGGAEANLTAVLCALNHSFPEIGNEGLFQLKGKPLIYCSSESHHSIVKAARVVGLGYYSVKNIPTNKDLSINIQLLSDTIQKDKAAGGLPFMVVGTAGTTGSGALDDLVEMKKISRKFGMWFHVDAAYGGAAILHPKLKSELNGIESSDSITFDVHKWLSVPMGASMFLTSSTHILSQTFRISTEYMPKEAKEMPITDPFTHSIQWSRRFIGLKLFLSLAVFGWEGYENVIVHQTKMGELLKEKLQESGWSILNHTPLPIVCFSDERFLDDPAFCNRVCQNIVSSGKSWISVYPINSTNSLRACITNYETQEKDINYLVQLLNEERRKFE